MDVLVKDKLTVEGISKAYGETDVLKEVSFTVRDGEFLSILGPSGCGKTTLLRILVGLLKPDTGRIIKDDSDVTNEKPDRRGMGIVFQNYALFENMSVRRNIEYALRFHKDIEIGKNAVSDLIDVVGLSGHEDKMPRDLSGGQQQRVAIARTLILKPEIVLFDEPMSALDVATRLSMRRELKDLQKEFGTTMIYVTHDQEEAFSLSDRIMIMDHGEISQIDTPDNICAHPANDYVRTFVLDNIQTKIESLARFASR